MAEPKAIMRWIKVTSQKQADLAGDHNGRLVKVANADQDALHPNVEFVATDGRGYWELANGRIKEVIEHKVRADQVLCMEAILTASPEFFERDGTGRAVDMSKTQWAKDQLNFINATFGEKNVIGCVLHQDEKTPHFHVVVVPLTADGRLSAKRLFNPITLRDYQTQYAEAMSVHGLERGVKHSQAEHIPMKAMYGRQVQTAAELAAQLGPPEVLSPVVVAPPGVLDFLAPAKWAAAASDRANEQIRAFAAASTQRVEMAEDLAVSNAAAKDQVRTLQKQLATSEELKQGIQGQYDELSKRLAGGEAPVASALAHGNKLLDRKLDEVRLNRQEMAAIDRQVDTETRKGNFAGAAQLKYDNRGRVERRNEPLEADLSRYAGGATRLADLDAELAQQAAKKAAISQQQALLAEEKRVELAKQEQAQVEAGFAQARAEYEQAKQRELDTLLNYKLYEVRNCRIALAELIPRADQFERQGNYVKAAEIRFEAAPIEVRNTRALAELMAHPGGVARLKALDEEPARLAKQAVLDLLDKRIASAGWRIRPDQLTACLLVPADKVERVTAFFGGNGTARWAQLPLPGEPPRADGLVAVGVKYGAGQAHLVGAFFEKVRAGGGQVVEPAQDQARREQLQAQPAPTPAPPEIQQERPRSNDIEID